MLEHNTVLEYAQISEIMAPVSKQGSSSHDWENDSNMKKLLEKKRKAEDAELFNSEETMVLKRRAVVIAAQRTPLPRRSSEYVQRVC